jgi:D-citramalate synthase
VAALSQGKDEHSQNLSVLDTTLRDGEQTPAVNFSTSQKVELARQLVESGIERVEVCSASVSQDGEALRKTVEDLGPEKIEVLTFLDKDSVDWVSDRGGMVCNLLIKGSRKQLKQLGLTSEELRQKLTQVVRYSDSQGLEVNVYLEDWSRGAKESPEYVEQLLHRIDELPVNRVMLCDTLGVLSPEETKKLVREASEKFSGSIDFHGHDDYGLANANTLNALKSGASGFHATVNGLGERTGNAALGATVASVEDHLDTETPINLEKLHSLSRMVSKASGQKVSDRQPVLGEHAFTHKAGIHHDGQNKGDLYCSQLRPERFGREERYV